MGTTSKWHAVSVIAFLLLAGLLGSLPAAAQVAGWTNVDIGAPIPPGTFTESDGVYTMTTGGTDLGNGDDNGHFAYKEVTGNGMVTARVLSVERVQDYSMAGVMIRNSLSDVRSNMIVVNKYHPDAGKGIRAYTRWDADTDEYEKVNVNTMPGWVRAVRIDDQFTAYYSDDGVVWTKIGSTQTIEMNDTAYFGVSGCSHNNGVMATYEFSDISVEVPAALAQISVNTDTFWLAPADTGSAARTEILQVTNTGDDGSILVIDSITSTTMSVFAITSMTLNDEPTSLPVSLTKEDTFNIQIVQDPTTDGVYRETLVINFRQGVDETIEFEKVVALNTSVRTFEMDPADYEHNAYLRLIGYSGGEELMDFPVLVILSPDTIEGFSFDQFASPDGADLRFRDPQTGLPLSYEIDRWNVGGVSHVWVKYPLLTGTSDAIEVYWGNPDAADKPPVWALDSSTWSNGFVGVWHMNEPDALDSSLLGANGTAQGMSSDPQGIIGTCQDLALGDYLHLGESTFHDPGMHGFTASFWLNRRTGREAWIFSKGRRGGGSQGWAFLEYGDGSLAIGLCSNNDSAQSLDLHRPEPLAVAEWQSHVAVINRNDSTVRGYLNGSEWGQTPLDFDPGIQYLQSPEPLLFGLQTSAQEGLLDGLVDEVRISVVARSGAWLKAEYDNVANYGLFVAHAVADQSRTGARDWMLYE